MLNEQSVEDVARHVSALNDSVSLIEGIIASGKVDAESVDSVKRNYQHVELMLTKDFIIDSGEDLSVFEAVVVAGKDFVEAAA